MIDITQQAGRGDVAKRYAAERRFRLYGAAALVLTGLFLAFLIADIFIKGLPAFSEHSVHLNVMVNPDKIDRENPANSDFKAMINDSLAASFPDVTSRAERKKLTNILSDEAADDLKQMVFANQSLIGQTVSLQALASAEADLYLKGISQSAGSAYIDALAQKGEITRQIAWRFWTNGDSREAELAGIKGALIGSVFTVLVAILIGLPVGVAAAIYLEQFAPKNRWTGLIEVNINNLAAVPSIIFGLLGLAIFLNFLGLPRSTPLVGGIVLSLLVLPTIIIAARAALKAVPPSIKEAALGVGASEQQAVFHHVLPLALPGILTGTILALARAFGETAPLLMIGMVAFIVNVPASPTDAATVLPVQIYLWSDLPEISFKSKTAAAIIVLLVVLTVFNSIAIFLRRKFERRW